MYELGSLQMTRTADFFFFLSAMLLHCLTSCLERGGKKSRSCKALSSPGPCGEMEEEKKETGHIQHFWGPSLTQYLPGFIMLS